MIAELCAGAQAGPDEIGYANAIQEVEPQGHFFATSQTMARYNTEFYQPIVHDYANFGTWTERGSVDANQRATAVWQNIVNNAQGPTVDGGKVEALQAFIDRRTAMGGALPES